jgi:hypothetical protein
METQYDIKQYNRIADFVEDYAIDHLDFPDDQISDTHKNLIKKLSEKFDINEINEGGFTALGEAKNYEMSALYDYLIEIGADKKLCECQYTAEELARAAYNPSDDELEKDDFLSF